MKTGPASDSTAVETTSRAVTVKSLVASPALQQRIREVLDKEAASFSSSLIQLSQSANLAKCEPWSVIASAMIAAALRLPIDKNLGFAHIVPYKNVAQFQMGYKGFIQLALRTGQYSNLNVCEIYEGTLIHFDRVKADAVVDESKQTSDKIIGYMAYMKLISGFEHAEYWSHETVEKHARRYSQAYRSGYSTPWKDNFPAMAKKTVIKSLLSKWGPMSIEMKTAIVADQAVQTEVDGELKYLDNPDTIDADQLTPGAPEQSTVKEGNLGRTPDSAAETSNRAFDPDKPYQEIKRFCVEDNISEVQVFRYCQSPTVKLAKPDQTELLELADAKLRQLLTTWATILPAIKAQKVD